MPWGDVKLADVKTEAFSEIPAGTYTFTLLPGAQVRVNKFNTEELVVSAAISEGDFAGRRIFLQYPDPTSVNETTGKTADWSAQALKKLEIALGVEQTETETPDAYLNRVANNGHSSFTLQMGPSRKIRTGESAPRIEPKMFSVAPAA